MKTKISHILFFFIITINCNAQKKSNDFWIYSNVLQTIDLSHPKINLGIEMGLKKNYIIGLEMNYYYYNWQLYEKTNGFSIDLNLKYLNKNRIYYSAGIKGGFVNYYTTNEFVNKNVSDTMVYKDDYYIKKKIGELNFKIGYRNEKKLFVYDIFVGIGIRYKDVMHYDRIRIDDDFYKFEVHMQEFRDKKGEYFSPVIKFGILLGLKIN